MNWELVAGFVSVGLAILVSGFLISRSGNRQAEALDGIGRMMTRMVKDQRRRERTAGAEESEESEE